MRGINWIALGRTTKTRLCRASMSGERSQPCDQRPDEDEQPRDVHNAPEDPVAGCWRAFALALATSAAASLHAVTPLGPVWPGGAPPGSGTQAFGLDGSVVLIPGWFGPSHE